jgi:SAM-dependent methyltransferase
LSRRSSSGWRRFLLPPEPYILNPREDIGAPLGRWNLYIGGAHCRVPGYVNLDILAAPGVDVLADAHFLPFPDGVFTRVECDAVLEHVEDASRVAREIERVLAPGGYAHFVAPFCHPFHEYPRDFRRFSPDGLRQLAGGLDPVAEGWRTGPAATLLVMTLEFAKILLPWRWWRVAAHGVLGWLLWPLRYLDLWLARSPYAARLGNHCYLWLRKPAR